jgi:phage terminase small subunit
MPAAEQGLKFPMATKTSTDIAERPDAAKGLTERQWAFVREYFVDFNATAAYQRAGYTGTRASQAASEALKSQAVAQAISTLAQEYTGLSRAQILAHLGGMAFADKKLDSAVKLGALDRLAKITGLYSDGPVSATQVIINVYPEEEGL